MNDLFSDAVAQLLADQCTPAVVRQIEAAADARGAAATLWQHLEDAGFADALVPEAQGGAGLSLTEVFPVLELCGAYALPVPLAQTLLARAALAASGVPIPKGNVTMALGDTGNDAIKCEAVACGRVADWVLVVPGDLSDPQARLQACLLPVSAATSTPGSFVLDAGLAWSADVVAAAPSLAKAPSASELRLLLACINAAQLAGALMTVFNRTLQYANDRVQFGRPIGKFQAIQHQLSVMAEHAFAARMAAQMGCRSDTAWPDRLRVAVAKARTSEAALEVAGLAHSIHGAIGFTQAFDLQLFTRRLHAWRQAGGSESYWHTVVGEALVDGGASLALDLIRTVTDVAPIH